MKPNKDMTAQEFSFSVIMRRIMNDLLIIEDNIEQAKGVAPVGNAMATVALLDKEIHEAQENVKRALKCVGM